MDTVPDPRVTAALARNDQYLRDFIEAFDVCPFARTCRERGRLHRAVLLGHGEALTAEIDAAVLAVQGGDPGIEVALLLLPEIGLEPAEFEALATQVARRVAATLQARGERLAFHIVAFHPRHPFRDDDAHRLVGLMRRSPDPTLQLVRATVLDALRGPPTETKRYVALEDLADLPVPGPPSRSLSTRIAEANLETWKAHAHAIAPLLASLVSRSPR